VAGQGTAIPLYKTCAGDDDWAGVVCPRGKSCNDLVVGTVPRAPADTSQPNTCNLRHSQLTLRH
jgi:hypothetical protein